MFGRNQDSTFCMLTNYLLFNFVHNDFVQNFKLYEGFISRVVLHCAGEMEVSVHVFMHVNFIPVVSYIFQFDNVPISTTHM